MKDLKKKHPVPFLILIYPENRGTYMEKREFERLIWRVFHFKRLKLILERPRILMTVFFFDVFQELTVSNVTRIKYDFD